MCSISRKSPKGNEDATNLFGVRLLPCIAISTGSQIGGQAGTMRVFHGVPWQNARKAIRVSNQRIHISDGVREPPSAVAWKRTTARSMFWGVFPVFSTIVHW
jgi:hypothetical protein